MLLDLVPSGDTNVATALADKGGNIGSGEENQGDGEVLDEGDIETVLAAELDIGALEEVKCGSIEPTLCQYISTAMMFVSRKSQLTLGYGKKKAAFETGGNFRSVFAHHGGM
jgi:hypothetical protein